MDEEFYAENPYGSARLGAEEDAYRLENPYGPVGIIGDTVIRVPDQTTTIVIGPAGSGKLSKFGLYQLVSHTTKSFFMLDMGGQYMSTTWHWNLAENRKVYALNSWGIGAYPDIHHPVDLWSILKDDQYLFDNARLVIAMGVIEQDSQGDNAWVSSGAKRWGARILIVSVFLDGRVTPLSFWETLNRMDSDDEFLKELGRASEGMPYNLYSTFVEIYTKKHTSEKEYGAIMGCLKDSFDWLSSRKVAESVSGDADYLRDLANPNVKVGVYYLLPGGSGKSNQSLTRMFTGIGQLHCVRTGLGAHPLFFIEEAAALGKADFIKSAVSEFRKYFRTILVYQSYGQLEGLFNESGAQEILDSCGMQVYMGGGGAISSARRLADTIGKFSLPIDDAMAQANHYFRSEQAQLRVLFEDADPLEAAHHYEHERIQSSQQRKTGRYVLDPVEILKLKNGILIITPGSGLPTFLSEKLPNYWENPSMVGRYGPDPLFPPLDQVTVPRRFFKRSRRFIREEVPEHLAHWPNHSNGQIAYVQGYKTW